MIRLPELTQEERAFLQFEQTEGDLQSLAERLRQKLIAVLGQKASVSHLPGVPVHGAVDGDEPLIEIEPEFADLWLTVRYGGRVEATAWQVRDKSLLSPLAGMIRRALAETILNSNENATWPQAMRFQISIGRQQGMVNIFWNNVHAMSWAGRVIREKT